MENGNVNVGSNFYIYVKYYSDDSYSKRMRFVQINRS